MGPWTSARQWRCRRRVLGVFCVGPAPCSAGRRWGLSYPGAGGTGLALAVQRHAQRRRSKNLESRRRPGLASQHLRRGRAEGADRRAGVTAGLGRAGDLMQRTALECWRPRCSARSRSGGSCCCCKAVTRAGGRGGSIGGAYNRTGPCRGGPRRGPAWPCAGALRPCGCRPARRLGPPACRGPRARLSTPAAPGPRGVTARCRGPRPGVCPPAPRRAPACGVQTSLRLGARA